MSALVGVVFCLVCLGMSLSDMPFLSPDCAGIAIAELIVADAAKRHGITFDWQRHKRPGGPVTLVTLAIAGAWLWLRTSLA